MTWNELKTHIEVLDDKQANSDVTVHCTISDDFFKSDGLKFASHSADVLDEYHPYLEIPF